MLVSILETQATLKILKSFPELVVDVETTGLRHSGGDRIFGVAFARGDQSWYFNFNPKSPENYFPDISVLRDIFQDPNKLWIGHNLKFDLNFLSQALGDIQGVFWCTMVQARVERNDHLQYSLDACAKRAGLGEKHDLKAYMDQHKLFESYLPPGRKLKKKNYFFDQVPLDIMAPYAEQDAKLAWRLYQGQQGLLASDLQKPQVEVVKLEIQTLPVLARMERRGIRLDRDYCSRAAQSEQERLSAIERAFAEHTGQKLVDSAKTLAPLFEKQGFTIPRTEKGNQSLTDDVLAAFDSPLARIVQKYRNSHKRLSTYWDPFLEFSRHDGRIHANFNQAATATGRLSSSEPNLQNIVADDDSDYPIRRAFLPEEGEWLVSLDYKAMEYFLLLDATAKFVGYEFPLLKRVKEGQDIHQATADLAQGSGVSITRQQAKTVNFLTLYGGGIKKLAAGLRISEHQAREIQRAIFGAIPEVTQMTRQIVTMAQSRGWVHNWLGRRYYFPDPNFAYKAVNYWDQGGCSEIMKRALVQIDPVLSKGESKILLTIHDEIVLSMPEKELCWISMLQKFMREAYPHHTLPLETSVHRGKNLHDLEEYVPPT